MRGVWNDACDVEMDHPAIVPNKELIPYQKPSLVRTSPGIAAA